MTDFKVGDKVRYVASNSENFISPEWVGLEGVITEVTETTAKLSVTKSPNPNSDFYGVGSDVRPFKSNLELVGFTFNDIRKGDTIRRTCLRTDDSKIIWEGTAHRKNNAEDSWLSYDNFHLAYKADARHPEISLELLERPEPPHWSEEKPVGSMFLYGKDVDKALWKKVSENVWTRTFLTSERTNTYTNSEVKSWIKNEQEWIK